MSQIALIIVEDNPGIRMAMEKYLFKDKDLFKSVVSYESVEELLEDQNCISGDILLLDINLPGMSGIEGIIPIKKKFDSIQIVMISVMTDSQSIFKAICSGASGYIDKETSLSEIKEALMDVYNGGSPITPSIARKVFDYFQPSHQLQEVLSHREQEVVEGIVDGLSYKLIADRLTVSINTVRKYIRQVYTKLQINSKGELIAKYHETKRL
jgi:DNA-binding NarL/FixJ family response regulator